MMESLNSKNISEVLGVFILVAGIISFIFIFLLMMLLGMKD